MRKFFINFLDDLCEKMQNDIERKKTLIAEKNGNLGWRDSIGAFIALFGFCSIIASIPCFFDMGFSMALFSFLFGIVIFYIGVKIQG